MLDRLGVGPDRLGAVPVKWVRLVRGGQSVTAPLPFPARSVSRRVLDEALLQRAAACGAEVVRGETIRAVQSDGTIERAVGGVIRGTVFLATGKHDLRGSARPRDRRMVGFKTYVRLAQAQFDALAGGVEIVLLPGGYAGLQNVEDGRTVLCWLARGGDARACLAHPHVAARLEGASAMPDRLLSVAGMPYGFLAPPADFFRLGDQAAVMILCRRGRGNCADLWRSCGRRVFARRRSSSVPAFVRAAYARAGEARHVAASGLLSGGFKGATFEVREAMARRDDARGAGDARR